MPLDDLQESDAPSVCLTPLFRNFRVNLTESIDCRHVSMLQHVCYTNTTILGQFMFRSMSVPSLNCRTSPLRDEITCYGAVA